MDVITKTVHQLDNSMLSAVIDSVDTNINFPVPNSVYYYIVLVMMFLIIPKRKDDDPFWVTLVETFKVTILIISLFKAKASYSKLNSAYGMSLKNYEELKNDLHNIELKHDNQQYKNYKVKYEQLKIAFVRLREKHLRMTQENNNTKKVENVFGLTSEDIMTMDCQTLRIGFEILQGKYTTLYEENKECISLLTGQIEQVKRNSAENRKQVEQNRKNLEKQKQIAKENTEKIEKAQKENQKRMFEIKEKSAAMKTKYLELVEVNRKCMKANSKAKHKANMKQLDHECKGLKENLEKLKSQHAKLIADMERNHTKYNEMRQDLSTCNTSLETLKDKCKKLMEQRKKFWEIETEFQNVHDSLKQESQKFQTMIKKKLDFVAAKKITRK
ncbi:polyamine-modulated factor 1-binding protein 1-like [Clytia hemisphaerica]|uniref:Uncharacterized protein n=1 Tax=Clytia hemisphaerica TaxID=252671 RepID=A0A7M5WXJ9_9CNID